MNTLNFLDANVWLALLWSRHVHSERARDWFERAGEEQFFFCRFTQITVLRLLTTQELMGEDVKTMTQAWDLWDKIWADTRVAFSSGAGRIGSATPHPVSFIEPLAKNLGGCVPLGICNCGRIEIRHIRPRSSITGRRHPHTLKTLLCRFALSLGGPRRL